MKNHDVLIEHGIAGLMIIRSKPEQTPFAIDYPPVHKEESWRFRATNDTIPNWGCSAGIQIATLSEEKQLIEVGASVNMLP
jgi:hypothetical protein